MQRVQGGTFVIICICKFLIYIIDTFIILYLIIWLFDWPSYFKFVVLIIRVKVNTMIIYIRRFHSTLFSRIILILPIQSLRIFTDTPWYIYCTHCVSVRFTREFLLSLFVTIINFLGPFRPKRKRKKKNVKTPTRKGAAHRHCYADREGLFGTRHFRPEIQM